MGACDFLWRKFTRLDFLLVLLALVGLSAFYFQKVTRTRVNVAQGNYATAAVDIAGALYGGSKLFSAYKSAQQTKFDNAFNNARQVYQDPQLRGTGEIVQTPVSRTTPISLPEQQNPFSNSAIITNDILKQPRIGYGEKGSGSGNKIDFVSNVAIKNPDGTNVLTVYPTNQAKPFAIREFPSKSPDHGFTDIVDNYAGSATQFPLKGGAILYQIEGSLSGVDGRFEWIVDPRLGGVTHRFFVKDGTINGVPIQK